MLTTQEENVYYPESDGKPMAETDVHRDLLLNMVELLKQAFPDAYASGNLFLYYVEGDPRKVVAPDAFLCRGQGPGKKRIFQSWLPNSQLDLVMEFSSASTKSLDHNKKKKVYEQILKVPYYLIYDPHAMYLNLYRLTDAGYQAVENNEKGYWELPELGLQIGLELPNSLCLFDASGNRILDRAGKERQEKEEERQAKEEALQQVQEAEQEIYALKAQLKSLQS